MKVWPSIASSDQACLQQEIAKLNNYHHIHFDIEDGNFVPNITFGMKTIRRVRELTDAAFDCHLMVTDPLAYIQDLAALRFETVCFHWEAAPYPSQIIGAIRSYGMKAGIALNPRTPADVLLPYVPDLDCVLVMTSEPDWRGELFMPSMLGKIKALRSMASAPEENADPDSSPSLQIIADGGITEALLPELISAGAYTVVMGRAVFKAEDPGAFLDSLKKRYP